MLTLTWAVHGSSLQVVDHTEIHVALMYELA